MLELAPIAAVAVLVALLAALRWAGRSRVRAWTVRAATAESLSHGYLVVDATSATEAVSLVRANPLPSVAIFRAAESLVATPATKKEELEA